MTRRSPARLTEELAGARRRARRDHAGSVMSNTKWRLVFELLATPEVAIQQIIVKFVDVEGERRTTVPWDYGTREFIYSGEFGPYPLVGLEWIEIPDEAVLSGGDGVPTKRIPQELARVRAALGATGKQFVLEETESALRIIGHVKR